jgi:hypothetical protein
VAVTKSRPINTQLTQIKNKMEKLKIIITYCVLISLIFSFKLSLADNYAIFNNGLTQTTSASTTVYKNFFYGQSSNSTDTVSSVANENLIVDKFCIRTGAIQSSNNYQDVSLLKNTSIIQTLRIPASSPANTILCSSSSLAISVLANTDSLVWNVHNKANVTGTSVSFLTYFRIPETSSGGGDVATSTILAIMDDNMATTTLLIEQATNILGFLTLLIFLTIFSSFIYNTFIGVKQKPKHYE